MLLVSTIPVVIGMDFESWMLSSTFVAMTWYALYYVLIDCLKRRKIPLLRSCPFLKVYLRIRFRCCCDLSSCSASLPPLDVARSACPSAARSNSCSGSDADNRDAASDLLRLIQDSSHGSARYSAIVHCSSFDYSEPCLSSRSDSHSSTQSVPSFVMQEIPSSEDYLLLIARQIDR